MDENVNLPAVGGPRHDRWWARLAWVAISLGLIAAVYGVASRDSSVFGLGGHDRGPASSGTGPAEARKANGIRASGDLSVAPPVAPSPYTLPGDARIVTSARQLVAALGGRSKDIVVADGTYDSPGMFVDANGSRIYAQHLGGALFTTGIAIGGNGPSGHPLVQGLTFEISDVSKLPGGGAVQVWGAAGTNSRILDCVFDGNGVVPVGLLVDNPAGLDAERLVLSNFTDEGIRASDNIPVTYGSPAPVMDSISDISVDGVGEAVSGSSGGTAEAGLWIGEPVTNGVRRIKIRNAAWSGIETVNNAWDTTFSDLDIDLTGSKQDNGIGVYLEHFSRNLTFDGFVMTGVRTGFNAEWDDGIPGNAAAHGDTIENGTIDVSGWPDPTRSAGIYLDAGSDSTTVTGVTFKGQTWAGIGAYQNIGANNFSNNTYELAPGAVQVSAAHI